MRTVREAKATQVYPITCAGANIKDLDAANSSNTHIGNIKGFSQVKRLSFVINNRYGICLLDPYTSKDGYYNHQIVLNILWHERKDLWLGNGVHTKTHHSTTPTSGSNESLRQDHAGGLCSSGRQGSLSQHYLRNSDLQWTSQRSPGSHQRPKATLAFPRTHHWGQH